MPFRLYGLFNTPDGDPLSSTSEHLAFAPMTVPACWRRLFDPLMTSDSGRSYPASALLHCNLQSQCQGKKLHRHGKSVLTWLIRPRQGTTAAGNRISPNPINQPRGVGAYLNFSANFRAVALLDRTPSTYRYFVLCWSSALMRDPRSLRSDGEDNFRCSCQLAVVCGQNRTKILLPCQRAEVGRDTYEVRRACTTAREFARKTRH